MDRRELLIGGAVLAGSTGCGYILYPERRGRTGGRIDVPILIVDILWFLPGIIPGLICILVDFSSGCIYESGGKASGSSAPSPSLARGAKVEVELDGAVVATGQIQPDRSARLSWSREVDVATLRARGRMLVRARDGALAQAEVGTLI